jgi:hypothetical protein
MKISGELFKAQCNPPITSQQLLRAIAAVEAEEGMLAREREDALRRLAASAKAHKGDKERLFGE